MTRQCPQCGAPLSAGAPEGLCPACLLRQGAAADTATQTEAIPFQPPDIAEVRRLFPQLEILAFIGKGGMGAVYKARQPALDRLVALKLLPPQVAGGPGFAERFAREARALARLNHPNIVAVYEFGQVDGLPFFLMEFVDGLNLRELERAGKLSPREALQIVPQICEALQFAHDEGVVHRDIKPENILLDKKGRVKIADFGIAKIMGAGGSDPGAGELASAASATGSARLTEDGKIIGTPNYMAPEQVETPRSVDHRADIFSLGVVFYEMLTGELPLGKFAPPSSRARGVTVDVRLDEVVLRALEKEPERRYQQASQVKTAVQTIAGFPGQPQAPFPQAGFEYRSRATLFGLPLLHVATGVDPVTGGSRVARGIIAIGGIAQGVVAFGGMAMGGLTFGGMSVGVIAFGGCALGLVSVGGLAVALLAAFGGGAIAPIAVGGGAAGYLAFGGGVLAVHPLGGNASDEVARHFFGSWAGQSMASANVVSMVLLALTLFIMLGIPLWLRRKMLADSANSATQPFPGPSPGENRVVPSRTALAVAAMFFAGLAAVLGEVTMSKFPRPSELVVWSILVCALLGVTLGIGSHRTRLGRWAMALSLIGIVYWLTIAAVFGFHAGHAPSIKSDYVGQAWFPNGDSIELTSVERSDDRLTVKGHYNLVSIENAQLALHITSTKDLGIPEDPNQSTNISRGRGGFELTHSHLVPGLPHVNMYGADHKPFAELYFGTQDEALREGKLDLASPDKFGHPLPGTNGFGAVIERVVTDSKDHSVISGNSSLRTNALIMIDFDSGRLYAGPKEMWDSEASVQKRWMLSHGVDAFGVIPEVNGLVGLDIVAIPVGNELWDESTAAGVLEQLSSAKPQDTFLFKAGGALPATWLFRTREGGAGILQITGFTENPRGVKIRYKLVQNTGARFEQGLKLAEQPPVVVETQPVSGARDVEPGEVEIRVRFSKQMADGDWSWSTAWENSTPETIGPPHYEADDRTCVLKVKLEPGKTYAWWLNSEKFHNFTDQAGRPAVPYLLIFQTKSN